MTASAEWIEIEIEIVLAGVCAMLPSVCVYVRLLIQNQRMSFGWDGCWCECCHCSWLGCGVGVVCVGGVPVQRNFVSNGECEVSSIDAVRIR